MPAESILVVCTANICRSPMAEALLRAEAERRGRDVRIRSAGVAAVEDRAVSDGSVTAMARRGIDISGHVSRPVDQAADSADLIITMETGHVMALVAEHPERMRRTYTLRELVQAFAATSAEGTVDSADSADSVPTVGSADAAPTIDSADSADSVPTVSSADAAPTIDAVLAELAPRSARGLLGADLDVADPFGRSARHYRRCADELEQLCAQLADGLWGPV